MDWIQVATIVGANLGMFLWATRQSRTDFLYIMKVIDEIKNEMRDFHARLYALEEKYKDKK